MSLVSPLSVRISQKELFLVNFKPTYKLNIISDAEFPQEIDRIQSALSNCLHSGFFDSFDGKKIYYEYFLAEQSRGSIVVVHGLSEFTKKFYELATYFLEQGYNVFLYDQRCHGFSDRLTDNFDLIHVDRFEDYVRDLETYIDNIVRPISNKPINIYSHSMGGAVSLLYLAKHQDVIQKAVLSAPMVEPTVEQVPAVVARYGLGFVKMFCGGKKKFSGSQEFNPEHPYRPESEPSRNRFYHNLNMRRNERHYQTSPMSLGWVYEALALKPKMLRNKISKAISTPVLLLSAERDTVVQNKAQQLFAVRCPACKIEVIPNTNHSLLTGSKETLETTVTRTLEFYEE